MPESMIDPTAVFVGEYLRVHREGTWEYVRRQKGHGAVMMVGKTEDDKIVLVEQYRIPLKCNVIEFPAGLVGDVESGEAAVVAAQREFFEETGYEAESWRLVASGPTSPGMSGECIQIFLGSGLKKVGPGGGDATEEITVHEVASAERHAWLERKMAQGCLVDPKVYAGFYFLQGV